MSSHSHSKKGQKEPASLIPLIGSKEKEFARLLEEAQAKAKSLHAEAEKIAGRILQEAEKVARERSSEMFRQSEKEIEQEVLRVLKSGEEEARKLKASVSEKIPEAAKTAAEFILPNGKESL